MAHMGNVLTLFLKADVAGDGLLNQAKLVQVFQAITAGLSPEKAAEVVNKAVAISNAQIGDSVRYGSFLSWVFLPTLLQDKDASNAFIKRIALCPWSVLGTHMKLDRSVATNAPEPGSNVAFVDPAGLYHIRDGGPSGAGGAAGVIYKFLGISNDLCFPDSVQNALTAPLLAKLHCYGDRNCIHVIGPDFRQRDYKREEAIFELAVAYLGVLREFSASGLKILRLLPISGGIFSGPFSPELSAMTVEALQWGFTMLEAEEQQRVCAAEKMEMCIFMENELAEFSAAFGAVRALDAGGAHVAAEQKMARVHWVPLESNPDMLNAFCKKVGMPQGWEFVDVFGVDPDLLSMVPQPCVALTLLYKTTDILKQTKKDQQVTIEARGQTVDPDVIYLKQYVGNACGTIASIHSLMNAADRMGGISLETPVGKFMDSIKGKTPTEAGMMLADASDIHAASEGAAICGQTAAPEADAKVGAHFIVFIEKGGNVYELDGAKEFPINHGSTEGDFLTSATKAVKANFMDKDPENINFNMMALVKMQE